MSIWIETSFVLPRDQARRVAKDYLRRYPPEGYDTHISSWHVTKDKKIFFKMKRTRSCD